MDTALTELLTDRLQVRQVAAVDAYGRRTFLGPFTTAFTDDFGPEPVPCLLKFADATADTPDAATRDSRVRGEAFVDGWLDVDLDDEVRFTKTGTEWFTPPLLGVTHWSDVDGSPDHTVLAFGNWGA